MKVGFKEEKKEVMSERHRKWSKKVANGAGFGRSALVSSVEFLKFNCVTF